jgi:hypothetical protein
MSLTFLQGILETGYDMVLYAPWRLQKWMVRFHKTELQDGDHKGCFHAGDKIPSSYTNDKIRKL